MSPTPQTYLRVAGGLFVLLLLTIGAAYLNLGRFNTAVAMSISLAKAGLIVLVFMHVRYQRALLWVFAAAGFFWLALMFTLTLSDYLTRGW